jgi:hypothetical protein
MAAGKAIASRLASGGRRSTNQKIAAERENDLQRRNYNDAFNLACRRRFMNLKDRRVQQGLMRAKSCRQIRDEVVAEFLADGKVLHKTLLDDRIKMAQSVFDSVMELQGEEIYS